MRPPPITVATGLIIKAGIYIPSKPLPMAPAIPKPVVLYVLTMNLFNPMF